MLTEDVVEASKASTGNIKLEMNDIDFVEMVQQVIGEFEEKFQEKNLTMVIHFDEEEAMICADGRLYLSEHGMDVSNRIMAEFV